MTSFFQTLLRRKHQAMLILLLNICLFFSINGNAFSEIPIRLFFNGEHGSSIEFVVAPPEPVYVNYYNSGTEPPTNWSQIKTFGTGSFTISGGQGVLTKTSSPGMWVYNLYDGTDYTFTTQTYPSEGRLDIIFRCIDQNNYFWGFISGSAVLIQKVVSGTITTIGSITTGTWGDGDNISFEIYGSSPNITIACYKNGVYKGNLTGITGSEHGKIGYSNESTPMHVDNTYIYER